jgi:carboxyl-terminal processing protease
VSSDIVMPDRYACQKWVNAMKMRWDGPTGTIWDKTANFNKAISNSKSRIEQNAQFKLIEENAKWIDSRSEDNTYSLNIKKFKIAQNAIEEAAKSLSLFQNIRIHCSSASL